MTTILQLLHYTTYLKLNFFSSSFFFFVSDLIHNFDSLQHNMFKD